ncbi:hypothetical protein D3C75_793680 [compost metagenome]
MDQIAMRGMNLQTIETGIDGTFSCTSEGFDNCLNFLRGQYLWRAMLFAVGYRRRPENDAVDHRFASRVGQLQTAFGTTGTNHPGQTL